MASSEADELEAPSSYEPITEWLQKLQDDTYGKDGHLFTVYGPDLRARGYMRVHQIAELTVEELSQVCIGIAEGTLRVILKEAKRHVEKVQRRIKKEQQQRRYARST